MKQTLLLATTLFVISSCQQSAPVPADLSGYESVSIPGSEAAKVYTSDADGNVVTSGYILNGSKTGTWTEYFPDGKIKSVTSYIDGKKNGIEILLTNRGQIESRATYLNDQLDGLSGKYKFGRPTEESNYAMGQLDGEMKTYFSNGKLQKLITFKNGKQDGPLKYYDEEGNVTLEYMYKNGEKVSGGIVENE